MTHNKLTARDKQRRNTSIDQNETPNIPRRGHKPPIPEAVDESNKSLQGDESVFDKPLALRTGRLSRPFSPPQSLSANAKVDASSPFYSSKTYTSPPPHPSMYSTSAVPAVRRQPPDDYSVPIAYDMNGYPYAKELSINNEPTARAMRSVDSPVSRPRLAIPNNSDGRRTDQQRSPDSGARQNPYLDPGYPSRYGGGSASPLSPTSRQSDSQDYFAPRPGAWSAYARSPLSPQSATNAKMLAPTMTRERLLPLERDRRQYARTGSQGSSSNSAQSVNSNDTIRGAPLRPTLADSADAMRRREDDRREMLNSWASDMRARRGQSHGLKEFMRARFSESKSIQEDRRSCGWDRDVANENFETRVVPSVEKEFNTVYENAIQHTYKEFMDQERDVAPGNGVEVRPSLVAWRADPKSHDSGPNGFGVVASVNLWLAGASYKMATVEWSFGHPPRSESKRPAQSLVRSERRSGDAGLYERDSRVDQSSRVRDSVARDTGRRSENTRASGQQLVRPSNRGEEYRTDRRGERSGGQSTGDGGSSRRRSGDRDRRGGESRTRDTDDSRRRRRSDRP